MARYVTKYEAKDGRLFDTEREADNWDTKEEIYRFLNATQAKVATWTEVSTWCAENLKLMHDLYRWPTLAKRTVDEALGIKPEVIDEQEAIEPVPDISAEVCDAVRAEQP